MIEERNLRHGNVLITDDVHSLLLSRLEAVGFQCDYQPNLTDAEVRLKIGDYEGLIVNSKINVDRAMLTTASRLRFVGRLGSGMEIIDLVAAKERGIAVLSAPEGNRNAVAEHALGQLLALANNLTRANREVKNFEWFREKNRGFELRGKTIGIVGFGHTGSSFAAKLLSWGMNVLIYDKFLPIGFLEKIGRSDFLAPHNNLPNMSRTLPLYHPSFDTEGGVESFESWQLGRYFDGLNYEYSRYRECEVSKIQKEADIISFHLPLTAETKYFANTEFFNACKKGVIVLNTSRGNVVKTADLVTALESGQVGGAALDVFENEKVATYTEGEVETFKKLFEFEQVIVSPHVAGWTQESKQRLGEILADKILKVMGVSRSSKINTKKFREGF